MTDTTITDIADTLRDERRAGRRDQVFSAPGHPVIIPAMLDTGEVTATVPTESAVRDWWADHDWWRDQPWADQYPRLTD